MGSCDASNALLWSAPQAMGESRLSGLGLGLGMGGTSKVMGLRVAPVGEGGHGSGWRLEIGTEVEGFTIGGRQRHSGRPLSVVIDIRERWECPAVLSGAGMDDLEELAIFFDRRFAPGSCLTFS